MDNGIKVKNIFNPDINPFTGKVFGSDAPQNPVVPNTTTPEEFFKKFIDMGKAKQEESLQRSKKLRSGL